MNVKIRNGQAHNLIEQALLKKLDEEHLHSNMEEISLTYSDQSYANTEHKYSSEVQECFLKENCTKFDNVLKEIGNMIIIICINVFYLPSFKRNQE